MTIDPDETAKKAAQLEQADLLRARQTPSQYANRAFVRTYSGMTRITFGEAVYLGEPTIWGAGVTLPTNEAVSIAHLIIQQADYEAEQQAEYEQLIREMTADLDEDSKVSDDG